MYSCTISQRETVRKENGEIERNKERVMNRQSTRRSTGICEKGKQEHRRNRGTERERGKECECGVNVKLVIACFRKNENYESKRCEFAFLNTILVDRSLDYDGLPRFTCKENRHGANTRIWRGEGKRGKRVERV